MNASHLRRVPMVVALLLLVSGPAFAERLIPFQGRLTDGAGDPLQGVYRVTFAIYDAETGGTPLNGWVETHEEVSILAGQINVFLGSRRSLDDPNGDANTGDAIGFSAAEGPRYLGIKIGEDLNQEMVPRHELLPSFHARVADRVIPDGITTEQIADGAVTTVKLDPTAGLPVGGVVMWWGEAADIPDGFEVCDGELPTTPGALLLGNKPDLRDRVPVGLGTMATTVGQTGGVIGADVGATSLTEAQGAVHTHPGVPDHQHPVSDDRINNCAARQDATNYVASPSPPLMVSGPVNPPADEVFCGPGDKPAGGHGHPASIGGATHTHERSAYLGMHFIIRVK